MLAVDFNKGSECEIPSGAIEDQRGISPLEAAFSCAAIPWPTCGVTSSWASAVSCKEANCQSVASSSKCQSHRTNGPSCVAVLLTFDPPPSASRPRTRPGTRNNGCTSISPTASAGETRHPRTPNPGDNTDPFFVLAKNATVVAFATAGTAPLVQLSSTPVTWVDWLLLSCCVSQPAKQLNFLWRSQRSAVSLAFHAPKYGRAAAAPCVVQLFHVSVVARALDVVLQPLRHAQLLSISFTFHACCVDPDELANLVTSWNAGSSSLPKLDRCLFSPFPTDARSRHRAHTVAKGCGACGTRQRCVLCKQRALMFVW